MPSYLPIGFGAGLAAAVLFASASTGPLAARVLLFFLAPLPSFLAGLGWGWVAALVASVVGTALVALVASAWTALVFGLSQGVPVVVLCYLVYLNREVPAGDDGRPFVDWYPIGRTILWAAGMAGVLAMLSVLLLGGDLDAIRRGLKTFIGDTVLKQFPQLGMKPLGDSELDQLAERLLHLLPVASATSWMAGFLFNLWLAGRITRASGRLLRPWPDLAGIVYPGGTSLALTVATVATRCTFLAGWLGLAAAGFAGALFMAHVLLGLAIIHYISRGRPARGVLLWLIYACLVVLGFWTALGLALLALAEPFLQWRRPPQSPPPSPPATT